jgi:rhomboid family GlyGly-CTERM serine protease
LLSVVAIVAHFLPAVGNGLQLDFALTAQGQWWRIWTGHLTHYEASHLFWDLLMFVVLGSACERSHPQIFGSYLVLMLAAISAVIGYCCDVSVYRGLSGIDTGLFAWFAADQIRNAWAERDRIGLLLWLLAVSGLVGKLAFEIATGQTLFVDSRNFTPLVESHLAGLLTGLAASLAASGSGKTDIQSVS